MASNILNHNREIFGVRLDGTDLWDFHISLDGSGGYNVGDGLSDRCLITLLDTNDGDCVWMDELIGKDTYAWSEASNPGITLHNIGLTGVDNGTIWYQKDRISNRKFIELYTKSELTINEGDLRLHLRKVRGNNGIYAYPVDTYVEDGGIVTRYAGGFYQGFFRDCEGAYKVLPRRISNGLTFEVVMKRQEIPHDGLTLNDVHPDNKGFFLYIGTRAENKWYKGYIVSDDFTKKNPTYFADDYLSGEYAKSYCLNSQYVIPSKSPYDLNGYFSGDYLHEECSPNGCKRIKHNMYHGDAKLIFTSPEALNTYNDNARWTDTNGHRWVENEVLTSNRGYHTGKSSVSCNCSSYFADGYLADNVDKCDCSIYAIDGYLAEDISIDPSMELTTSGGHDVWQPNVVEIRSDNKFLMFDRTKDGMTADKWEEGTEVVLSDIRIPDMENYFLLFDRTDDGYTASTISSLIERKGKEYDISTDIYANAIGFRVDDDGSIGYKLSVMDCDSDDNLGVIEEYTHPDIVKYGEWATVAINIVPVGAATDECADSVSGKKMRIVIYVNGRIRLVSKELPILDLRPLNDTCDKQEGVPFNISIGGGTQGLCDVIYPDFMSLPEDVLPLEKNFGGTFIGYIRGMRVHDCPLTFTEIVGNSIHDGTYRHEVHKQR